jgi:hypothetical protein
MSLSIGTVGRPRSAWAANRDAAAFTGQVLPELETGRAQVSSSTAPDFAAGSTVCVTEPSCRVIASILARQEFLGLEPTWRSGPK